MQSSDESVLDLMQVQDTEGAEVEDSQRDKDYAQCTADP